MSLKTIFLAAILSLCSTAVLGSTADTLPEGYDEGAYVWYDYPAIEGYRLDWCFSWARDCGQRAANAFCHLNGHLNEAGFTIDPNIGLTKIITTGQVCNEQGCDGFKFIRCRTH